MKNVYMVIGYSLLTGRQDIVDYVEAATEREACRAYEERNFECEANEIIDVMTIEEFEMLNAI